MTAAIIDFQTALTRRRTGQPLLDREVVPIRCPDLDAPAPQQAPVLRRCVDGDPEEFLTFEVRSPSGLGLFRQTNRARTFLGRRMILADGRIGTFAGHFRTEDGFAFARVRLPEWVRAEPLNRCVLLPEAADLDGAA